jgi:hypothetical protein
MPEGMIITTSLFGVLAMAGLGTILYVTSHLRL